ncbi:MAG: hypothetical protein ACE5KL_06020 [Alphaproteobacteria bacterium]
MRNKAKRLGKKRDPFWRALRRLGARVVPSGKLYKRHRKHRKKEPDQ